jgi:3-deoxy-7-phosphoheptulonate synthase
VQIPTDDLRILDVRPISSPMQLIRETQPTPQALETVIAGRAAFQNILHGGDDRLAVVVGPCSIHDTKAAMEYAHRLAAQRKKHAGELELIMRVYFEKPRTTTGWKGLINDPELNGTFEIEEGLRMARKLLLDINAIGVPTGCEYLDMITPQYIADLVGWGAIGARTTESQAHRQLASGLSCAVGFKNGTKGDVQIAVDAVLAAAAPHHFMTVTKWGVVAVASTAGNKDCHIILRGGSDAANYDAASVQAACALLAKAKLPERLMVDASHANSRKNPENQKLVMTDIAAQIAAGEKRVIGVMLESNLVAGRQDIVAGKELTYGQSVTDACIDWDGTEKVFDELAAAIRARRGC